MTLFYVADPMCSWCYAFRDIFAQVTDALPSDTDVVYIMGGLAKDSDEPMPEDTQQYIKANWKMIEDRTPTRFNWDFWETCEPRRSTYPACRACYAAEHQEPDAMPRMYNAIQHAYYQDARNPSDVDTLIAIAGEIGLDTDRFADDLVSDHIEQMLQDGFKTRRAMNINSFPSLVLQDGDATRLLSSGYTRFDAIQL